jgi:low affinity Fe/Cu permease
MNTQSKTALYFEKLSIRITQIVGSTTSFVLAFMVIIIWAFTGPLFNFSDTWQLVINTGTTIITFLMVFIIQKSQNKDSRAIQLKLNELIAAGERTSNRMISVEDLSEDELLVLSKYYSKLAEMAKKENDIHQSHSIDEAVENHEIKSSRRKKQKESRQKI